MKRIPIDECIVGRKYHVQCGIWDMKNVIYCGPKKRGSRTYHAFTTGASVEAFDKSWNIVAAKSKLKVYE